MGGGSQDPEVIRDGDLPAVGSFEPTRQYDTFHNGDQGNEDWIGYDLGTPREFRSVLIQEGVQFGDGGWFDTLDVQVFDGSSWNSVSNLSAAPLYPGANGISFETFRLSFDPVVGTAIRVHGDPGGPSSFISIGELRVFATQQGPVGPTLRNVTLRVTDQAGNASTATAPVSLDNTPPQVQITSPVDGSLYSMSQSSLVPMEATVFDSEHGPGELTCSWVVTLHHDEHSHPEAPDPNCSTSALITPVGCDGHTFYYEFTLTVSDPAGLSTTQSVFMYPNCCGATDPQPVDVCPGQPATFSTTPGGTPPFTFQWKKNGTPLPGATSASYSIASVVPADAGSYSVLVQAACGTTESAAAALTVKSPTTATTPSGATVCPGEPAAFSTTSGGTGPFTYLWKKNGAAIPGATASSYAIPAVVPGDAGAYSVAVTGACGTIDTPAATLLVSSPVTATAPTGASLCPGEPVAFSTTAGGTGPFTYQWKKNGAAIPGATLASYTLVAVTPADAGSYSAEVIGECGSVETAPATLTVNQPTSATNPLAATVCVGSPVSFSTTAGGTGPFTYQWKKNGAPISGATASSYAIAAVVPSNAGAYSVAVTGACGTVEPAAATLVVNAAVTASAPAGATVCVGSPVSFSTTAGGTGPFTYQWKKNGTPISGATASSYAIAAVVPSNAGAYSVAVTGVCGTIEPAAATLVVNAAVTASAPAGATVCVGSPVSFSTTAGGTGPFTYQWKKNGAPISGATASSYAIAAVVPADAGAYSVAVTGACGTVEPAAATLVVNATVTASAPAGATVCVGSPVSFSTTAGGTGPFSYQWKKNGAPISGATASSYAIAAVVPADAGAYSVAVTGACGTVEPAAATLVVNAAVTASAPAGATVCVGSPVSFSTTAGGTGPFTYQWKKNGTPISGATASSYAIAAVVPSNAGAYSVAVTGACGTVEPAAATLVVNAAVTASAPAGATVCVGSPVSFSTTAGGTGPFTYQWKKNGTPISGATASSYAIAAVVPSNAGAYSVAVTGACGTVEPAAATLVVNATVTASAPAGATVCVGSPVSFSTTAGGTGPFTYQWKKNGTPISGATASSYAIAAVVPSNAGAYSVAVTGACGTVEPAAATLVVNAAVTASAPAGATVCVGSPVSFSTTAGGTGPFTYQWKKNGAPISGATASSYAIAAVVPSNAGAYSVAVTGACGTVEPAAATLVVNAAVTASAPAGATVCVGSPVSFSTTAGGTGPFSYQWKKNGAPISGATASSYAIAAVVPADAGAYSVAVTGACGTIEPAAATLVVNATVTATTPGDVTACLGQTVDLTTTPGGTGPFTYQWSKDGSAIAGATSATYSIAAVGAGDAGLYSVEVVGACGSVVAGPATLSVSGATTVYCTAKVNSQGCLPAIGFTGMPSASAGSGYNVTATQIVSKVGGLFIYSRTGPAATPFQGGFLCVAAPVRRTSGQLSGGSTGCSGSFNLDFNAYIASGADPALQAGVQFWGQYWSRDPASPTATSLTDALTAVICP